MTKFNEKVFRGDTIWIAVAGCAAVRRRFVWNSSKSRYQDPPGGPIYEARRIDSRGAKRISKVFSSLQNAREWKERRGKEVEPESMIPVRSYTVNDLVADFKLKRYPFLSEGTVILYERRLAMLGPLSPLPVNSLTPKDVTAWITWLSSPAQLALGRETRVSFEKELKTLGALLRWHIEENDDSNLIFPIKRKHFARSQVRRRVPRHVTLQEAELHRWLAALKAEDPFFYAMAFVQVFQAFRVSEVCAMKWSNLDLEAGRYQVREHVVWPRVGGRRPRIESGTKTRSDSYWVPLWAEVQSLLRMQPRSQSDLIFTKDGDVLTYRQVQRAYDNAFEAAGLPHRGTHVCRHTGSTLFLDQTQDLLALQQLGGWMNQHMPQHYAKIRARRAESAMRAAEARLKLVKPGNGEAV